MHSPSDHRPLPPPLWHADEVRHQGPIVLLSRGRVQALVVHAVVTAAIIAVVTFIWAMTTRWYFWPFWVALPLVTALAIHAFVDLLDAKPELWQRRGMTRPLATQAGVSLVLAGVLVAIWAATTRWYFWPVWPIGALALATVIHWIAVAAGRIEHLEVTRSGSVAAQESDLRRIERDLHDGAQARLVALGMHLGLAEQKLAEDPAAARALVSEAREGVGEALRELRDLVRGIRPPVLADRGLAAAVEALADRSPIPVDIHGTIEPRPDDTVETAAYFVVAEALANAAKHAGATRIDVRMERRGRLLQVEVTDDGRGLADPAGRGLTGLRQRVEALDGRLTVWSPEGGPTVVRAELPCGS